MCTHSGRLKFKTKSTFCPQVTNTSVCRLVERDVDKLFCDSPVKNKFSLSMSEKDAFDKLCRDKDTVVKPADKGGGLVILPTALYNSEVLRQLQNTRYYKALTSDPTRQFQSETEHFLKTAHLGGSISEKELQYLFSYSPTKPIFYILPKIHKDLTNPPGRPIVAGISSLTEPISNFVDFVLRPLVTSLPSYLRDTCDFLQCLSAIKKKNLNKDITLATMDVTSLYTNIITNPILRVFWN